MVVVDGQGLPLACRLGSASPAEVRLAEPTLEEMQLRVPWGWKLIADRAYDSDPLRERLRLQGIELICPHRRGRKRARTHDGRPLRRYRHRWKVERTFV